VKVVISKFSDGNSMTELRNNFFFGIQENSSYSVETILTDVPAEGSLVEHSRALTTHTLHRFEVTLALQSVTNPFSFEN
jgi:hypothetical protein